MNRDLSKFEPPKTEPDGLTKKIFGMPKITCAACGSPNVRGYKGATITNWIVSCLTAGQARVVIKDSIYDMMLTSIENGYIKTSYRTEKRNGGKYERKTKG